MKKKIQKATLALFVKTPPISILYSRSLLGGRKMRSSGRDFFDSSKRITTPIRKDIIRKYEKIETITTVRVAKATVREKSLASVL